MKTIFFRDIGGGPLMEYNEKASRADSSGQLPLVRQKRTARLAAALAELKGVGNIVVYYARNNRKPLQRLSVHSM